MTTKNDITTIEQKKDIMARTPQQTNNEQGSFNAHIEGRVGRLEGAVENLTHEVQETSKAVRDIASGLGTFKEQVLSHIGTATAPKWPLIASFMMMALTVVGLGGTVVTQTMSGQGTAISKLSMRLDEGDKRDLEQARLDGKHDAWRETIDKKTEKLDVDLQREMRLINENTDSKLQANDKATLAKLTELQNQTTDMRTWRLDHVQENAKQHGTIESKIKEYEAAIARIEERQYAIGKSIAQLDYLRPGAGTPPTPFGTVKQNPASPILDK